MTCVIALRARFIATNPAPLAQTRVAVVRPDLLREYLSSESQGDLVLNTLKCNSMLEVSWRCSVCQEVWSSTIRARAMENRTCPCCEKRTTLVDSGMSLAESHPDIAALWHPTRNGALTPSDVVASSSHIAWWKQGAEEFFWPIRSFVSYPVSASRWKAEMIATRKDVLNQIQGYLPVTKKEEECTSHQALTQLDKTKIRKRVINRVAIGKESAWGIFEPKKTLELASDIELTKLEMSMRRIVGEVTALRRKNGQNTSVPSLVGSNESMLREFYGFSEKSDNQQASDQSYEKTSNRKKAIRMPPRPNVATVEETLERNSERPVQGSAFGSWAKELQYNRRRPVRPQRRILLPEEMEMFEEKLEVEERPKLPGIPRIVGKLKTKE